MIPILPKGKVLQRVFTEKSQLERSAEGSAEYSMDKMAPLLSVHINHQKILANNTINVPKEYHILKLSADDGKTGSGLDNVTPKLPDNFSFYMEALKSSKQVDMYLILPTERIETIVYNISMLIKDRAGNSKNYEFKLRLEKNIFEPELIEEFRGENNRRFCKYSINYQYNLKYLPNYLYAGDSKSTSYLEFIAKFKLQDHTIDQLMKITPSVSGPVRYKTFLDQAKQSVKFTFSALSTAKPIDEAIVNIEILNELFVTTQTNGVGICDYYLHNSLFIEAGHRMQTYQYRIP
ncbi:MAG: hypothetical protein H8E61_05770, partial [Bacteroidetes bacterium]|nr:hypothetical protein [Bacteroidota bacterium]